MRIALIGSDGYIGTELQPLLAGADLLKIDAGLWGPVSSGTHQLSSYGAIVKKLRQFEPDTVVNLAAIAHDPAGLISANRMMQVNGSLACQLWGWCSGAKVRFIQMGSLSVFGEGSYCAAKRMVEETMLGDHAYFRHYGVLVRSGTVFGPCTRVDRHRTHLLLNSMMLDAVARQEVHVSNPQIQRPVVNISVLTCVLADLIMKQGPNGVVKNILDCSRTLYEFATDVASFTGACVKVDRGPDPDERNYGWPAAYNLLGYKTHLTELKNWTASNRYDLLERRQSSLDTMYENVRKLEV